jgi:hypothetical protein
MTSGQAGQPGAGKVELKARFVELRAKGYSYARIAQQLRVAKGTLANWHAELEGEIARCKSWELESLQEQFFLLKEGRIRLLGEQLKAIRRELQRRPLAEVSTDRLLELQLKYYLELKAEVIEPRPLSGIQIAELTAEVKSGTKVNADTIARGIDQLLRRYRAGLVTREQAQQELTLYQALLKAQAQAELQEKLARLEALFEGRR